MVGWGDGDDRAPNRPSLVHCRALGALAADLHNAWDLMQRRVRRFDIDLKHLLDEPLRELEPILQDRPRTCTFVTDVAERIRPRIAALPVMDGAFGLCHGDLTFGNTLFDDTGPPTLIDFDCSGYGWRADELAVFRLATLLGPSGNRSA